ncbi:hypothetical protein ACHAWF_014002, partial [Thalassiosira exigua]
HRTTTKIRRRGRGNLLCPASSSASVRAVRLAQAALHRRLFTVDLAQIHKDKAHDKLTSARRTNSNTAPQGSKSKPLSITSSASAPLLIVCDKATMSLHPAYAPKEQSTATVPPQVAYQVDYVAVNCGKIVAASKRRIRFKFGYTNLHALSQGKTSHDCRGSEHEVVIEWSLSSGKQAIAFDQQEVFFDVGGTTQSKLTHCWKDSLGHTLEVKVHAASMSTKFNPDADWKQYDLIIDGVSFFLMPKIFEIGTGGNAPESFKLKPKFSQYTPNRPHQALFTEAKNESNRTTKAILPPECSKPQPDPVKVADLLSFDEFGHSSPTFAAFDDLAAPGCQPNPVTPPPSLTELVLEEPAPGYGLDGTVTNLGDIDDLFGASEVNLATNDSIDAKMHQENHKNPNMNTVTPPVTHYQQQGLCNGAAGQQHQQVHYNNYAYQQACAQRPGFGY